MSAPDSDTPTNGPARRVMVSLLSGVGSSITVGVLGLLIVRLMTRRLGPIDYGLFVTAFTFVTLTSFLTDLGVSDITGRDIAKDPESATEVLGHNLGLRLVLSFALVPLLILVGSFLYRGSPTQLRWTIVIIAVSIPFQAVRSVATGYFISGIRNHITAAVTVLNQLVYVAGLVVALYLHTGIIGCAFAYLIGAVVASAASFYIIQREVRFRPRVNRAKWSAVLTQSISIGVIQIVNLVYLKADTLLISLILTPHAVGLYGVAYVIITFLTIGPGIVMTSLMPLLARSTHDQLDPLMRRVISFLATIGILLSFGTFTFAPAIIQLLAGPKFAEAVTPLRILSFSCIFTYLTSALGFAAFARNKHHRMLTVSLIGLLVNVAANIAVIPTFGIDGAAWATVGSEFITMLGVYAVFRRDLGIRTPLVTPLVKPTIIAATISFLWTLTGHNSTTVRTLFYAPLFAILYFVSLATLRGLPEDVVLWLKRLFSRSTESP